MSTGKKQPRRSRLPTLGHILHHRRTPLTSKINQKPIMAVKTLINKVPDRKPQTKRRKTTETRDTTEKRSHITNVAELLWYVN